MKLGVGVLVTHTRRWDLKFGLVVKILYTEDKTPLYDVLWAHVQRRTSRHLKDELQLAY